MDVVYRSLDSLYREQVAIETCPFLPEPKAELSWSLANGQLAKQRRLRLFKAIMHKT